MSIFMILFRSNLTARAAAVIFGFCLLVPIQKVVATPFDLVIVNGRVVDPANAVDGFFNIGIIDGKIAVLTSESIAAERVINAKGMLVLPGFIDLHSHAMNQRGQYFAAYDGVTTALELEAGVFPVASLKERFSHGALINYGASSSHIAVRQRVLGNTRQPHFTDKPTALELDRPFNPMAGLRIEATSEDMDLMIALHEQAVRNGALGVGLPLDYMSQAVGREELNRLFSFAAKHSVPIFVHTRRGLPGDLTGLEEMIALAGEFGASVHICHLQSMAMSGTARALELIAQAKEDGVKITTEAYPYGAGSTSIGAAVFYRDWQSIFDITYEDIQWTATGERLTESSFQRYQKEHPAGIVVHHYGDESWTQLVMKDPSVMVASDAMPVTYKSTFVHPRGVGSFTRVLSKYVDELDAEGPLSLSEAVSKMTSQPAALLGTIDPQFLSKGQLGVGADADITIIDPDLVDDRATYLQPLTTSAGVQWVMICGRVLIDHGELVGQPGIGNDLNRSVACATGAPAVSDKVQ